MQIRLTVLGPLSGHDATACACDVLVTAPAGTALAAVASGLAAAVAAAGSDLGGGAVVVHAGTERLDPQRCALGEPPLIDGAVLSLGTPAGPERHAGVPLSGVPEAAARLHVVSGPDAGGVHLLHGGEVRVGRSSAADVPLDDPDVSRLHCAVTLTDDGRVTLHDLGSTNGTLLDGEPVGRAPAPLPSGALVRAGESTLSLHGADAPAPAVLPAVPDGEGHLRVGTPPRQRERGPAAPGAPTVHGSGTATVPQPGVPAVPGQRTGATDAPGRRGDAPGPRVPSWAVDAGRPGTVAAAAGPTHHVTGSAGFGAADDAEAGAADVGIVQPREPGNGTAAPAPGPAPADARRRGRGIGAWARRLTGGLGGSQRAAGGRTEGGEVLGAAGGDATARETDTAAALRERWPDPAAVLLTALGPGPRLWERGPDHPDLLTVRLGTADRYGPDGGEPLPAVPVTAGLRRAGALGLAGPRERLSGLARSVLAQLAALHPPTTLELVLISADRARTVEERLAEWSWLGWLPQLRPVHGQDCRLLVAYDREQAEARTAELARRLDDGPLGPAWATASPEAIAAAAGHHRGPYTVLIVDGDPGSAALRETVARLAVGGPAAGIHLLCLADAPATTASSPVPATLATAEAASPGFPHCGTVALLSGDVATVVQVIHRTPAPAPTTPSPAENRPPRPLVAGDTVIAALDAVSGAWAERFARALAPLRADLTGEAGQGSRIAAALPRTARLLDELGLARATPASLTARWAAAMDRGARPGGRAVAVLGAGPHGPLSVDLAADGPHLLVEGGAGTGKTELLRSLAASLAAADRPDRLSLVLVDGAAAERGEGLRVCTDLPHVSTYLAAADPVRMREFAQALSSELKRRAELLGTLDFAAWHDRQSAAAPPPGPAPAPGVVSQRRPAEPPSGDLEPAPSGTLKLRTQRGGPTRTAETALPRLVVLVDDFDALVAPALGSTGRPAAGSVVRALESVARDGERLGVHLIAASGRPDRTADTAAVERAGLRATLEIAPPAPDTAPSGADGGAGEPAPGRGRLQRPDDGAVTPFQAGRVTGRIPRTATLRPTVVALDWQRMGDPPTRRPVRELGNGPTDLALLASALQRAAQSAGARPAPPLL
ncbi:cell division protein FtsK [Streptomyces cinnamoneus]|uniref:Cell division protein FtsK n=1 Tax=Streptomyces cinnamoneus TaxID=53446 RepID=A0A2G1XEZ3_STRCJ|nr:FtsK/SpoIIIE domain-containing protein [Streptomyces cinnamoneus]PHQ49804.1 cell division protein FtsK [Streptomyces cinnamoneus]PPT13420.1 cell division protein FtsK [Streptomyces cinnamoneus]